MMMTASAPQLSTSADLAARLNDLPSLPALVADLVASIEDEDIDMHVLAGKIERDQGLASKTLRIANSPFFGLAGRIGSIQEAATVVGLRTIRSLALASAVGTVTAQSLRGQFDLKGFWVHAFQTGIAARELAGGAGVSAEHAFVAGLLHDVGKLALAVLDPQLHAHIADYARAQNLGWYQSEVALGAPNHAELGGAVARRWHFPETLCQAIALHHADDPNDCRLAQVIQIAEALSKTYDVAMGLSAHIAPPTARAWSDCAPNDKALRRAVRGLRTAGDIAANLI